MVQKVDSKFRKFFCRQGWQINNFFSGALFSLVVVATTGAKMEIAV
jgi:CRISPR/Cas system-associated protein endoribonuclease Cas2